MPRSMRYAATIYFGLLMSGTLERPGWGMSPDPPSTADCARVVMPTAKQAKEASAKAPGATPASEPAAAPPTPGSPGNPGDLLR